jgi:GNAT superfamily N-acetyltransferase
MIEDFMEDLYDCETIMKEYGFISFKQENNIIFVQHFYTTREARGKKYAFELWNSLVDVCLDRGVEIVEAIVELYLPNGAQKLLTFSRVGFEPIGAVNNEVAVQNKIIKKFKSGEYNER